MKGDLALPKGVRNPGGFDQKSYLARMGIRAILYADEKEPVQILFQDRGNPLKAHTIRLKQFLSQKFSRNFGPRDAGFLKALFLGERSDLSEDFKDLFIKTGTMHILAVSGFNIGFLIASILLFLRPFPVSRDSSLLGAVPGVWLYCAVVGWQAPVVRASVMATLFILGRALGRKTDGLNLLGAAAIVILGVQPKQIFDVGFQLSFLAVFGMIVFVPRFLRPPELLPFEKLTVFETVLRYAKELFWVSFVCIVVTLPVTVQNFYIVSPWALLANLIVVPLAFFIFFMGVIFFVVGGWVSWVLKGLIEIFVGALFWIENIPASSVTVGKLEPWLWGVMVSGIVYLFLYRKAQKNAVRFWAIVFFLTGVFLAQDFLRRADSGFAMTVLDVGQGDAIDFQFPGNRHMLIDTGKGGDSDKGRWVITPFLKSKGVRAIETLVITHPQEDHLGGALTVLDEFRVRRVVQSGRDYSTKLYRDFQKKVDAEKAECVTARRGERLGFFKGAEILVLNPDPGVIHKNINDDSVVLKIAYGGKSYLLTGDIQEPAIRHLLLKEKGTLKVDILKVPHHGGKMGAVGQEFVNQVNPKISVISCGERNPFGHPKPETLAILSSIPASKIFRTDSDGAILLTNDSI